VSGPPAGRLSSECRVFRNHDETPVGTSVDGVAAPGPNVGKTDGFQCARAPAGPRGLGSRGAGQLKGRDQRRAGDEPGRVVHLFQVQLNSFPEIDQGRHRPRRRVHRLLVARADSAFYSAAFTGAVRRAGAFFPVTVRIDPKVRAAIAAIPRGARTPIRYPRAIWDDQPGGWISDAEAAETGYTAFASKKGQAITARLIVRRVRDLTPGAARGQGELFPAWRYHAIFADSPFATLQAEEQHRGHALAEQVFADLTSGPLAHLPSGSFPANAAWLACAAISHNLLRAAGTLASPACAKARGATLRRYLISVAARTARHGRGRITCTCPKPGTARPSG
jgi:hypothetical protein